MLLLIESRWRFESLELFIYGRDIRPASSLLTELSHTPNKHHCFRFPNPSIKSNQPTAPPDRPGKVKCKASYYNHETEHDIEDQCSYTSSLGVYLSVIRRPWCQRDPHHQMQSYLQSSSHRLIPYHHLLRRRHLWWRTWRRILRQISWIGEDEMLEPSDP